MAGTVTGLGVQLFDKTYEGNDPSKIANVTSGRLLVDAGIITISSGTQIVTGNQNAGTVYTSGLLTVQGTTSGTLLPVSISEVSNDNVVAYSSVSNVTSGSSSVISYYSVSSGSTFYLKEIIASASSGPVKVIVEYAASSGGVSSGTYAVGFFSSANPTLTMPFHQPIVATGPVYVRITMRNDSAFTQDLYATIIGRTI